MAVENFFTRQKMRTGRLPPDIATDPIVGGSRLFRALTALPRAATSPSTSVQNLALVLLLSEVWAEISIPDRCCCCCENTPLAHNKQRGYARCPVQQASCVWFQPAHPSALTATNVTENAAVECTDSVVKPIRTATTQSSASAMIALPPSDLRRARARRSSHRRKPQGVRHGRCWGGAMQERKVQ